MTEQRKSHRIHFDCFVDFEFEEQKHVCELYDLSIRGALIGACTGATPEASTPCRLTITLNQFSGAVIVMEGAVAHKNENRVGIHCEHMDIDSITHLRKLLEYNLGDSGLANRELDTLSESSTT